MSSVLTSGDLSVPQTSKRIYLDVCTLGRPYDDQAQLRIRLETDAYYMILAHVRAGAYALLVSPVHFVEVAVNGNASERRKVEHLLREVGIPVTCSRSAARQRAEELVGTGFGIADAAHVAYAEGSADAFITCDGRLKKRCQRIGIRIPVCTPVEFAVMEGLR